MLSCDLGHEVFFEVVKPVPVIITLLYVLPANHISEVTDVTVGVGQIGGGGGGGVEIVTAIIHELSGSTTEIISDGRTDVAVFKSRYELPRGASAAMEMENVVSVGLTYVRLLKLMYEAGCASHSTPLITALCHAEISMSGQLGCEGSV
jgi:hypothetical protein